MTTRGSFVAGASGALAAVALPEGSASSAQADVLDIRLVARKLRYAPAPNVAVPGVAYNGAIPGPVLRVTHGQRVRVRYVNACGEDTSVHWHGMILPNPMDGVAGITQPPVPNGGTFEYEFAPNPSGTRWYHDHAAGTAAMRGLFGMFIVDDPHEEKADAEFAIVIHDVPKNGSPQMAMRGTSDAPMLDPMDSIEMKGMAPDDRMGDEVAYVAHCINGATYPDVPPLIVKVGQRVRLRILNANLSQTRYMRLAGHRLIVTHLDGNVLPAPVECDTLRLGAAERCDAWFEVRKPGAWLLQTLTSAPLGFEQAVVVRTPDMARATPDASSSLLEDEQILTYELAGGGFSKSFVPPHVNVTALFEIEGGDYGGSHWTLNDKSWPNTARVLVRDDDEVLIRFRNMTDMEHPMHLHGHTFHLVEINGRALRRPVPKDVSLVPANGGTLSWHFRANSPAGRWLLHCHNQIHMMDGLQTEVVYRSACVPNYGGDAMGRMR